MKKWLSLAAILTTINISAQEIQEPVVYRGIAQCEFNTNIGVYDHPQRPGSYIIQYNNRQYEMEMQKTSTGAVRLENARYGLVWIQIPSKSMLLNAQLGQRIADQCRHRDQMVIRNTQNTSLGIQR